MHPVQTCKCTCMHAHTNARTRMRAHSVHANARCTHACTQHTETHTQVHTHAPSTDMFPAVEPQIPPGSTGGELTVLKRLREQLLPPALALWGHAVVLAAVPTGVSRRKGLQEFHSPTPKSFPGHSAAAESSSTSPVQGHALHICSWACTWV